MLGSQMQECNCREEEVWDGKNRFGCTPLNRKGTPRNVMSGVRSKCTYEKVRKCDLCPVPVQHNVVNNVTNNEKIGGFVQFIGRPFKIISRGDRKYLIDTEGHQNGGGVIKIYENVGGMHVNQVWTVDDLGHLISWQNRNSILVVPNVRNGERPTIVGIAGNPNANAPNALWKYLGDGQIVSQANEGLALDIEGAKYQNNTPVLAWNKHNNANQKWDLIRADIDRFTAEKMATEATDTAARSEEDLTNAQIVEIQREYTRRLVELRNKYPEGKEREANKAKYEQELAELQQWKATEMQKYGLEGFCVNIKWPMIAGISAGYIVAVIVILCLFFVIWRYKERLLAAHKALWNIQNGGGIPRPISFSQPMSGGYNKKNSYVNKAKIQPRNVQKNVQKNVAKKQNKKFVF